MIGGPVPQRLPGHRLAPEAGRVGRDQEGADALVPPGRIDGGATALPSQYEPSSSNRRRVGIFTLRNIGRLLTEKPLDPLNHPGINRFWRVFQK